ncbi:MAG: amidohydrolase family protein [Planctomycetaceae bacterium]|nr:amidohydrolase family protein [Planctomycetaceae bacterium]
MSNAWTVCLFLFLSCHVASAQLLDETRQPQGLQEHSPSSYAITGGRLVIGDGRIIENGVLVVHDEKIQAVGTIEEVPVPLGYTKIDASGRTIYPGLIDAYLPVRVAPAPIANRYWNTRIRAEVDVRQSLTPDVLNDATRRSQGIVAALFVPSGAIIDGTGAVASLGGSEAATARRIIRSEVGQHGVLTVARSPRPVTGPDTSIDDYPGSPMGAVALARQAMYDARWYRDAWQVVKVDQSVALPETNVTLEALEPLVAGERSLFIQTGNELAVLRADRFAREFGVGLVVVGSGREYRRITEIAGTGRAVICPLNFPPAPNVASIADARAATLESLMHWDHAPENPARLAEKQIKMAFTSMGLESPNTFLSQLRTAVQRGLAAEDALKALTVDAAELLGVSEQLGSLTRGKLASFIITDGDLFAEKSKIVQTWVAGKLYEIKSSSNLELAGRWRFQAAANGESPAWELAVEIKSKGDQWTVQPVQSPTEKPTEETAKVDVADAPAPESTKAQDDSKPGVKFDRLQMDGLVWNGTVEGKLLPVEGVARWSLVIEGPKSDRYFGRLVWSNGSQTALVLERDNTAAKSETKEDESGSAAAGSADANAPPSTGANATESSPALATNPESPDNSNSSGRGDRTSVKSSKDSASKRASYAVNYPLGMYGRGEVPTQAASVLFKDFTVWTSGPDGVLDHGSVLVGLGKIQKVFRNIEELNAAVLPEGTIVIEGQGRHLSPGLIDCHSHMATDSGVNEGTQSITAEVRIGDFIDCNDITIYRQLAGGLTVANVLHGSANPIGGQNQVIKLRWGASDEDLKLREAPQGIKFALGENVKRSNLTQASNRYPGSRMGVEQIIRDAFYNATEYRLRHRQWNNRRSGLPPRIDLELEALSEIIDGKRWVHCHSYRQDEILALIRTMDTFNIQIGTLQHIMEGYKVADAMANHGAMASAFADWWAYKLEVADAIPYAGSIMHDQGVVVSFNSDDGELGRRMNHEAAKAIKYGGIAPAEALKFVTLNPAKQLRIEQYVGSLEEGKHADIVVWTGSPLSTISRVEQTWIDGRKYFDHATDVALQKEQEGWRQALIQKVLETGSKMGEPGEEIDKDPSRDWPRYDEFCRAKGQ